MRGGDKSPENMVHGVQVVGLGTIVVDHLLNLNRPVTPGDKHEVVDDFYQVGGPVPTGLALLTQFGVHCRFHGSWGNDSHGAMIQNHLDSLQLDHKNLASSGESRTGFAHVWIDRESGNRTISAFRGTQPSVEVKDLLNGSRTDSVIYLDGWPQPAARETAEMAHASGHKVFIDLGSPKPELDSLLQFTTWVNCPASLPERAFGIFNVEKAGEKILSLGPSQVTITDGENGAWFFSKELSFHQPAARIQCVDSNGAGDIFASSSLYARLKNWDAYTMMRFSSTVAGLKCLKRGNIHAIPSLESVLKAMESFPIIAP